MYIYLFKTESAYYICLFHSLKNTLNYFFLIIVIIIFRKAPTPMHFVSYLLTFQTILAGPNAFFEDYMAYLDGTNFPKKLPKEVKLIIFISS